MYVMYGYGYVCYVRLWWSVDITQNVFLGQLAEPDIEIGYKIREERDSQLIADIPLSESVLIINSYRQWQIIIEEHPTNGPVINRFHFNIMKKVRFYSKDHIIGILQHYITED